MTYPLVRDLAADGIPVTVTCRVLEIARQPYYRWLADPITDSEVQEAYRINALIDAHADDPEYGYRYLADETADAGVPMAVRTAWRLCRGRAPLRGSLAESARRLLRVHRSMMTCSSAISPLKRWTWCG